MDSVEPAVGTEWTTTSAEGRTRWMTWGGFRGDLLGALEGEVARQSEGEIGEVAGAGAPGAQAFDRQDAGDVAKIVDELAAGGGCGLTVLGGGGVEEGVEGAAGERPADAQDDGGDNEGRDGVGDLECGDVEAFAHGGGGEAEQDGERGVDVGGEVDGVGGEGFGMNLGGDAAQGTRAGVIDENGEDEDGEGPRGDAEVELAAEEEAVDGFVDDPDRGGKHESGFHEGGKRFDLAVAVVVVVIRGTVGGAHAKEGDRGSDEIDAGVGGLREHAERAREDAGEQLEKGDEGCGDDRQEGGGSLG